MNKLKWVVAAVAAAAVLIVGGTWVYINVIRDDPPERLAFDAEEDARDQDDADPGESDEPAESAEPVDVTETADTAGDEPIESVEGTWTIAPDSVVGYRVGENLFGQSTEAVGRTNDVTGQLVIVGTTVTEASFEVDMATVESDDNRRDGQFRGRIMDVATYPTATLVLAEPIDLGEIPDDLEIIETTTTVDLTLRGSTRTVPVDLRARRNGSVIEIDGSILVVFADWGIPNPSTSGINTDDEGELEFILVFEPA